jgi:hypothetical protein
VSIDEARRLAESAVAALLAERAKRGGQIVADGVVWVPPSEAPSRPVRDSPPSRDVVRAFLETVLRDGAVAVRDLESKARAELLLAEGRPLSQSKPIRKAADELHVLRFRQDDQWFWQLPSVSNQDDRKMPNASSPVAAASDKPTVQDDLVVAPDVVTPETPTAQDDLAAARRKFIEDTLRWHESDEAKAVIKRGFREAEEIIKRDPEYARLGLDYASRS